MVGAVHGKGACMAGGMCGRGPCMTGGMHGRGACVAGGMRGIRSMSGLYASYWNAFFFKIFWSTYILLATDTPVSDIQTQRRHHQKSKTGEISGHTKRTYIQQNLVLKKFDFSTCLVILFCLVFRHYKIHSTAHAH